MELLHAIILGVLQGITEWLPVSSEGQTMLYMLHTLRMDPDTALAYAFYLHIGSMGAVLIRFRAEVADILTNLRADHLLTRALVIGTAATAVTGIPLYLLVRQVSVGLSGTTFTLLIGVALIATGIVLRQTDREGGRPLDEIADRDMILAGFAQGCAIIPGISRSGMTIAALLARRIEAQTALTLSFLMSVPAVLGAVMLDFEGVSGIPPTTGAALVSAALVTGYVSMDVLIRFASRITFWIFCIALGVVSIVLAGVALTGLL
ncbi:MAG: hypothetical protein APR63_01565 [Desulfuromonas sp. SDB]|nr:MAG: hypothetical protein APR63_01565 [Desulfuromonas sp. SDB]